MLTLPIPLMVTLIFGFLAVRHLIAQDRSGLFLILLSVCALQSLIVSLAQHYGVGWLGPVQPVTASLVAPIAWLTFQSATLRAVDVRRDALHLLVPVFVLFCQIFAPLTLDAVLAAIFIAYGAAILLRLHKQDTLPLARLESGTAPVRIWQSVGALLLLSALSDMLIALSLALGHIDWPPTIISIFTTVTLLGIGLLSLSHEANGTTEDPQPEPASHPPAPLEEHANLMARLDAFMLAETPYLDPDLSLARLARRLHVPIKQLSVAINQVKGENVSRYVNGHRIRHACTRLDAGESVTQAMLSSGFNTKSNFNREFTRVMGQSPSVYLREGKKD